MNSIDKQYITSKKYKLLLIDLDNTLIETKSGQKFPENTNDWKFKKGVLDAISKATIEWDVKRIAIITNQGGIAAGYVKPMGVLGKLSEVAQSLSYFLGAELDFTFKSTIPVVYYIAPSTKSKHRKPSPLMLERAMKQYWIKSGVESKRKTVFIGDASGLLREVPYTEPIRASYRDKEGNVIVDIGDTTISFSRGIANIYDFDVPVKLLSMNKKWAVEIAPGAELRFIKLYRVVKDHSDSDQVAAENAGIDYMDIDDFIELWQQIGK